MNMIRQNTSLRREHKKRNKKQKVRRTLAIILAVLMLFSIYLYWGNTSIQVTKITIHSAMLPSSFVGYTIVQVSDLHNARFGHDQKRLLEKISNAHPDMIVVTGDLIDYQHTGIPAAMEFINGAVGFAPIYFITGNHEAWTDQYESLKEQLLAAGVILLNDQTTFLSRNGEQIQILGLEDPSFFNGDASALDIKLKNMLAGNDGFTILLSHRPEYFQVYVENQVDLVFCGHAHGGQIRVPFIGGLFAPGQGTLPKYTSGVYEKEQTQMVVSRGLGNSVFPLRVNNRPELIVVTLAE